MVDAILSLYQEGNVSPSLDEIADRSGVSHRSVFRYFQDLEELYRVAIERHRAMLEPFLQFDAEPAGDRVGRIEQFVDHRFDLYERVAPVARVGRMHALRSDVLMDNLTPTGRGSVARPGPIFAPTSTRFPPTRPARSPTP